jgi:hypothetical protein
MLALSDCTLPVYDNLTILPVAALLVTWPSTTITGAVVFKSRDITFSQPVTENTSNARKTIEINFLITIGLTD